MKLQQGAELVEIGLIQVLPGRQRAPGFVTEDLEASIRKLGGGRINEGLLQPILINHQFELQIGERRFTACRNLGHTHILSRFVETLSPVEARIVELTENLKRLDLKWEEQVKAVAEIHGLFLGSDPDWTLAETGQEIGLEPGTISMYISVHTDLENPRVAGAGSIREAYNVLKRRDQRRAGEALAELLETPDMGEGDSGLTEAQVDAIHIPAEIRAGMALAPSRFPAKPVVTPAPPPESILQLSFLDWAPKYSGAKFNLVHCDFPYGVGLGSGPQGRGSDEQIYTDTKKVYWELLEAFCQHLDRFMSVSGHLMFWTSADTENLWRTKHFITERCPSLVFHKFPLIWGKSDNAGISSDPRMGPRHTYEACLLASRSSRQIVQVKADFYQSPSDRTLHPSTKPEPMLREFMRMLVDEHTELLDPTCGSGAALRAAESLGAKRVLGLEFDPQYIGPARTALRLSRSKAAASRVATMDL